MNHRRVNGSGHDDAIINLPVAIAAWFIGLILDCKSPLTEGDLFNSKYSEIIELLDKFDATNADRAKNSCTTAINS